MKVLQRTKSIDHEKERSEKKLSLSDFLELYNKDLPSGFPPASKALLEEFVQVYPNFFKEKNVWTLANHRKKFMDWLPQRLREPHQPS